MIRPWAVRAVGWRRGDVSLPASGAVTRDHEGVPFWSSAGKRGSRGGTTQIL